MAESSLSSTSKNFEDCLSRLVKIGNDLYKLTILIHSVNIHKLKNREGKTIHVTRATARLTFKKQFSSVDFISFEVWPRR